MIWDGQTWFQSIYGLPENSVTSVASFRTMVLSGTAKNGIFAQMNLSSDWEPFNSGLTSKIIRRLYVSPSGSAYASTPEGLFVLSNSSLISSPLISSLSFWSVISNPSSMNLNIELRLKEDARLQFSLINLLGAVVLNSEKVYPTGISKETLDISKIPKGTYLLNCIFDGRRMSKKILLY